MTNQTAMALLILGLLGTAASAQETENEDPDQWAAEIGVSLNSSGGNKALTVLLSELDLTRLDETAYEATVGARFRYGRSQGEDVAQNFRANAAIDFWPDAAWSPFVFADVESDPFKKLDARVNGGGGVKHTVWQDGWDEVSVSGAILYSYENLELEDPDAAEITRTGRLSWRGRGRLEFGEGRRLEEVVFYQPAWDSFDDYLFTSETAARWALTQKLAFTTSFLFERDSTPAPDVDADDWALSVGLSLATRW